MLPRIQTPNTSIFQHDGNATASRCSHSCQGALRWAQRMSGWRVAYDIWHAPFNVKGWEPSGTPGAQRNFWGLNSGVSGQTLDDIIAREEEFLCIPCDEFHMEPVTNTISSQIYTTQELFDKAMALFRRIKKRTGKKVKVYTVLARAVTSWGAGSPERIQAEEYNKLVEFQNEFEVVDFNEGWVDYTQTNDVPAAGDSVDGIHFGAQGAYDVGKALARRWKQEYPEAPPLFDRPSESLIPGSFFQGSAGSVDTGATGQISSDMRVVRNTGNATAACTTGTDADIRGGTTTMVFTPGGDASQFQFRTNSATTTHDKAGKWVQATIKLKINSANATLTNINLEVQDMGTGGAYSSDLYDSGAGFITVATDGYLELRTPPHKMVADSTGFRVRLNIYVAGSGADASITVGELAVVEVADPEDYYDTVCPNSRVVAPRKALSTKNGILTAGTPVKATDFSGNGQAIIDLERAGLLVSA